jgi:hypothetical protein
MKYSIRSAILSLIINAAFVWLVNDAMADGIMPDYYSVAIGKTKLERNHAEGWWNQTGSDQVYSENTNSWALRAGWNLNENWSLEAGWRDLGKFSMAASFISDENHDRLMAGQCAYPCDQQPMRMYGTSETYGAELRIKYHPFKIGESKPYISYGAFQRHTNFRVYDVDREGNGKINLVTPDWSETFTRPSFAIGIDFKNAFVEYAIDKKVSTQWSAVNMATTISVGVKF